MEIRQNRRLHVAYPRAFTNQTILRQAPVDNIIGHDTYELMPYVDPVVNGHTGFLPFTAAPFNDFLADWVQHIPRARQVRLLTQDGLPMLGQTSLTWQPQSQEGKPGRGSDRKAEA